MTESSTMDDATMNEKYHELMDIDSAIGSDIETDTKYDGASEVDDERDLSKGTKVRMAAQNDNDYRQQTGKLSEDFTAIFSAAQQEELRQQLDEDGPHRAAWEKIMKSKPSSEYFQLTKGDDSHFADKQKEDLASLARIVPPHQFRAYSLGGVARSGGFSSPSVFLCNSSRNHIKRYRKLDNMTINDAATMLTAHTCWIGRKEDEFLSWTSSFFLALTIAILRHEKGQKHVHIAWGDIRKLQAPDGEQATFYPVVELQLFLPPGHILDLTERTRCKLRPRHFTQEAVSVGDMLDPEQSVGHALLEDLVENGLLELLPELVIDDLFLERNGMYNHTIWMKRKLFRVARPKAITEDELKLCLVLASCFNRSRDSKPDFWCVITLLSLRLRPTHNQVLQDWVRRRITERDIEDGIYDKMERVADNLPDVKQKMLLAWEAAEALGLNPNPVPQVAFSRYVALDRFSKDEIELWPTQYREELDALSWELITKNIYGPDKKSLQARRDIAKCDEELSALLKLARLAEKAEGTAGVHAKPPVTDIPLSNEPLLDEALSGELPSGRASSNEIIVESLPPEPSARPERQTLAEAIKEIMEAEKKAEEERQKREEKKLLESERKATNRQNREELCKKLGIPTPSEERRRKKAEKRKEAEDDTPKYFLYAKPGEKRKAEEDPEADNDLQAEHEPEMVTVKRQRREKSTEEQRADFLLALERISGRLRRREASRSTMAGLHEQWKEKKAHVLGDSGEESTDKASSTC